MYIVIDWDEEIWKPLECFDIVKSRYIISNYGNIKRVKDGKYMLSSMGQDEYSRISLKTNSGKRKTFLVHRLVAKTFVEGYDLETGKVYVDHKDCNRYHNYYENLEWVTMAENNRRKAYNGKQKFLYIKGHNCKYDIEDIQPILELLEEGLSPSKICSILQVPPEQTKSAKDLIYRIKLGAINRYIDTISKYDIPRPVPKNTLPDEEIHQICKMMEKGMYSKDIINELNIPPDKRRRYIKCLCDIRNDRGYKEIASMYTIPNLPGRKRVYSDELVHSICKMLESGDSVDAILDALMSNYERQKAQGFIYDVKHRRTRRDISEQYDF